MPKHADNVDACGAVEESGGEGGWHCERLFGVGEVVEEGLDGEFVEGGGMGI